ncbi:MAG TPA: DUF4129 domain-containing protein [Pyrinomonadaceae bacterium]|nr:DUF4129 domain-containing protein [Pyrinomonadaceae bacterium]
MTRQPAKTVTVVMLSIALLLIGAAGLRAATLADYTSRVSRAVTLIDEVQRAYEHENGRSSPEQVAATNLALVRQQLPEKETVKLDRQTISVDNSWLYPALSEFEKSNSSTARREVIARIAERLRAIQEHLRELGRVTTTAASDKDAEKGRLAEILRRPEYLQTAPEASALQGLLDRFLRWLGKLIPHPKPIQPGSSAWMSNLAQIVIVAICLGAIAMLIWRFGPRLMSGRRKKKTKREARIVLGERLEADQTAADLLAQAEILAREGNLRAAIRKAYIALLCELGDRKIISLAQHKTNRDYLNSVRDKASLYASMRKLTSSFELHWYGFVPANENDWNEFRADYKSTLRT